MEKTKFLRGDLIGLNQLITRFSVNGIALESVMALLAFKEVLNKLTKDAQEYMQTAAKMVDADLLGRVLDSCVCLGHFESPQRARDRRASVLH